MQDGVGGHDAGEAILFARKHAQAQRAAPVLGDERDVTQVQGGDESVQPVDVAHERVVGGLGELVRAAIPDVVGCDDAQPAIE